MSGGLVLVCVTTCLRPKMLAALLESLAATKLPPAHEVRLLVLDNDANKSAEAVFAGQTFPFSARYAVEPTRGLCAVRNRALDEAKAEKADFLAFVDDDQTVDENWLCALLDGMEESGADAINGFVEDIYENGKPWWVRPNKMQREAGVKKVHDGLAIGLSLMKSRLFWDLRFDMRFNFVGAEDYDYSTRALRRGFVMAVTGKAYAKSIVPPEGATLRNYFRTQWQRQTGYVLSHRLADGYWKTLRFLPKGAVKFCKGLLYCVLGLLLGKKVLAKGIKNLVAGSGLCYGVFALGNYQKYAKIEGE